MTADSTSATNAASPLGSASSDGLGRTAYEAWCRADRKLPTPWELKDKYERAMWVAAAEAVQAAERERHAHAMRCALEALDYCIEDSAELLSERTVQWGQYRKDRQAAMASTLGRHRAVAERLRAMLKA